MKSMKFYEIQVLIFLKVFLKVELISNSDATFSAKNLAKISNFEGDWGLTPVVYKKKKCKRPEILVNSVEEEIL